MKLADGREIVTDGPVPGARYNVYECPGRFGSAPKVERTPEGEVRVSDGKFMHSLLSMDVDDGVTPFIVTCPDDGAQAYSRMYPKGEPPAELFPVRMVWRLATKGERKRELRDQGKGGHFASGGLAREWVPA